MGGCNTKAQRRNGIPISPVRHSTPTPSAESAQNFNPNEDLFYYISQVLPTAQAETGQFIAQEDFEQIESLPNTLSQNDVIVVAKELNAKCESVANMRAVLEGWRIYISTEESVFRSFFANPGSRRTESWGVQPLETLCGNYGERNLDEAALCSKLDCLSHLPRRFWNYEWERARHAVFAAFAEFHGAAAKQDSSNLNAARKALLAAASQLRKVQTDFNHAAETVFKGFFNPNVRGHIAKLLADSEYEKAIIKRAGRRHSENQDQRRNVVAASELGIQPPREPIDFLQDIKDALQCGDPPGTTANAVLEWASVGLELFGLHVQLVRSVSHWKILKQEISSSSRTLFSRTHPCPPLSCLLTTGGFGLFASAPIPQHQFKALTLALPPQAHPATNAAAVELVSRSLKALNKHIPLSRLTTPLINPQARLATFALTAMPDDAAILAPDDILRCAISQLGSAAHLRDALVDPPVLARSIHACATVLSDASSASLVASPIRRSVSKTSPPAADRTRPRTSRTLVVFNKTQEVRLVELPADWSFRDAERIVADSFEECNVSAILRHEPLLEHDAALAAVGASLYGAEVFGRRCAIWCRAVSVSPSGSFHVLSNRRSRRGRYSKSTLRELPWNTNEFALLTAPAAQMLRTERYTQSVCAPEPLSLDDVWNVRDSALLHSVIHAKGWNLNNALWRLWLQVLSIAAAPSQHNGDGDSSISAGVHVAPPTITKSSGSREEIAPSSTTLNLTLPGVQNSRLPILETHSQNFRRIPTKGPNAFAGPTNIVKINQTGTLKAGITPLKTDMTPLKTDMSTQEGRAAASAQGTGAAASAQETRAATPAQGTRATTSAQEITPMPTKSKSSGDKRKRRMLPIGATDLSQSNANDASNDASLSDTSSSLRPAVSNEALPKIVTTSVCYHESEGSTAVSDDLAAEASAPTASVTPPPKVHAKSSSANTVTAPNFKTVRKKSGAPRRVPPAMLQELLACELMSGAIVQILRSVSSEEPAHAACGGFDIRAVETLFSTAISTSDPQTFEEGPGRDKIAFEHFIVALWLALLTAEQHIASPCRITPETVYHLFTIVAQSPATLRACVQFRCNVDVQIENVPENASELTILPHRGFSRMSSCRSFRSIAATPSAADRPRVSAALPLPNSKCKCAYPGSFFAMDLLHLMGFPMIADLLPQVSPSPLTVAVIRSKQQNIHNQEISEAYSGRRHGERQVEASEFYEAALALCAFKGSMVRRVVLGCCTCHIASRLSEAPDDKLTAVLWLTQEHAWNLQASRLVTLGLIQIQSKNILRARLCFQSALLLLLDYNGDPRTEGGRGSSSMLYPLWVLRELLPIDPDDDGRLRQIYNDMFRICRYYFCPTGCPLPLENSSVSAAPAHFGSKQVPSESMLAEVCQSVVLAHEKYAKPNLSWLFCHLPSSESLSDAVAEWKDTSATPADILAPQLVDYWERPLEAGTEEVMLSRLNQTAIRGSILVTGSNAEGCLGLGEGDCVAEDEFATILAPFKDLIVKDIACGANHAVASSASSLYVWGAKNSVGILGLGDMAEAMPVPAPFFAGRQIECISCGPDFTVCIDNTGVLFAWGENGMGQLGLGHTNNTVFSPTKVSKLPPMQTVSCGEQHTVAVSTDGFLYTWGRGSEGELGVPKPMLDSLTSKNGAPFTSTPLRLRIFEFAEETFSSDYPSEVLTKLLTPKHVHQDHILWRCEPRTNLRVACLTDDAFRTIAFSKNAISEEVLFMSVACGGNHTVAVDLSNFVWTWGDGSAGQLGLANMNMSKSPPTNSSQLLLHNPWCAMKLKGAKCSAMEKHPVYAQLEKSRRYTPCRLSREAFDGSRVLRASADLRSSSAIDDRFQLWTWGGFKEAHRDNSLVPKVPTLAQKRRILGYKSSWLGDYAAVTTAGGACTLFHLAKPENTKFSAAALQRLNAELHGKTVRKVLFGSDFIIVLTACGEVDADADSADAEYLE